MLGRRFASFVVLVLVLCTVGSAQAGAEVTHPFLSSFDGSETPAGSFGQADGVAVDGASGDVYVADIANNVIDKFTAAGKYLCQVTGSSVPSASECDGISGSATAAGSFSFARPGALAVDNSGGPSSGDLYVTDVGHGVVDRFSPGGEYLGEVGGSYARLDGVGVDGAGNVWVYDGIGVPTVYEFDASGSPVFQFNTNNTGESGFAVDTSGDTYSATAEGVFKFDSQGHELSLLKECVFCETAVATDLASGDVYVDEKSSVAEYDSAQLPVGQFGSAQLGSEGNGGIGVDPVSGTVYVANAADGKVYVFGPAPGPRVTAGAAQGVATTKATLEGTVNPEGGDTTYQFEYGTTTSYGQVAPVPATDAGSGSSAVPVSAEVTGLLGGTVYHYRILASNANGTVHGADRTFLTLPVPVIDGVSVTGLTASSADPRVVSADLGARIDPRGVDTTYRFEYGTSTSYGASVPVPDGDIGAGSGDVQVSEHVTGLSAGTTYHWRVVARNASATTTGVDHTFVYDTVGGGLPDHRAYEMVTPPRKNGALIGDVSYLGESPVVSDDGSQVIGSTVQCFAGAQSCTALRILTASPYAFTRTSGGWKTTPLAPPAQLGASTVVSLRADAGTALFSAPAPPQGEEHLYAREPDGSFTDVGPITPPAGGTVGPPAGVEATADFSHIVWLLSPGSLWPFDTTAGGLSAYEIAGGGNSQPVLVGVSGGVGSTALISRCATLVHTGVSQSLSAMSADGRTVYFIAKECPAAMNGGVAVPANALYARIDGSRTVAVSAHAPEPVCDSACQTSPPGAAEFEGASSDGSKVFFTSTQQLTDAGSEDSAGGDKASGRGCSGTVGLNGCNLYEYDFSNPAGHELVDVSKGDVSGHGPRVRRIMGISADGSHVYFIAQGVLTATANAQGQVARDGANNLYVYERDGSYPAGRIAFIADLADREAKESEVPGRFANVTPDGRFLVFLGHGALTADDTSSSAAEQVFRYDAQSGELVRISIGNDGFNDNGNRASATPCAGQFCSEDAGIVSPQFGRGDPTMSHDGSFVFFQSPVALAPGALDDTQVGVEEGIPVYAMNVYEWHEGHVYLISDGRDASKDRGQPFGCGPTMFSSVCLLGTDGTGSNVFFTTADRLVGQDTDTELDYYDARICTASDPCIASESPSQSACLGEACHGAPGSPPAFGVPGSSLLSGVGNIVPASPVVKRVQHARKKPKRPKRKRKAPRKKRRAAVRNGHIKRGRR